MGLNDTCIHDVSDEDCYKCFKIGITICCPAGCEYYESNNEDIGENEF